MEPLKQPEAYSKLLSCTVPNSEIPDLIWGLLRCLRRDITELPNFLFTEAQSGQIIPLWTGYNHKISNFDRDVNAVAYPPVVDAKLNDMGTVYTTMKK